MQTQHKPPQPEPGVRWSHARRTAALLAVGAAVLAAATAPPAAAAAPDDKPAKFTIAKATWTSGGHDFSARTANNGAAYWTPERMRNARQVELPANATWSASPLRSTGRPGAINPIPALAARVAKATGVAGHGPETPKSITVGKVFAHNPITNVDYQCSASTVASPSMMLVLTAGHCIHGGRGGAYATNWVFVPRFTNGSRPYGTWGAKYYISFNEWQNDSNFDRDVGFVTMWPNAAGQRIVDVVGGNGLTWNQPYEQHGVTILGYPGEAPFVGDSQQTNVVTTFRIGTWPNRENTMAALCTLNGGSSGGPWLLNYTGGPALANGIQSTRDPVNRVCRTPYFDDAVHDLYLAIGSSV